MPVRSLTSPVLRWPAPDTVREAARTWAAALMAAHPEVLAVGYFGSYARGDAGVGSDLDLVVVVRQSPLPFERRAAAWPLEELPVPAEAVVYTLAEWRRLCRGRTRFGRMLAEEAVWLAGTPTPGSRRARTPPT